jgi:hypothetical protein
MICTTRILCSRFQQFPGQIPAAIAKFDATVASITPQRNFAHAVSPDDRAKPHDHQNRQSS